MTLSFFLPYNSHYNYSQGNLFAGFTEFLGYSQGNLFAGFAEFLGFGKSAWSSPQKEPPSPVKQEELFESLVKSLIAKMGWAEDRS